MRRCRYSQCRAPFEPRFRTTEVACSDEHAVLYAKEQPQKRRDLVSAKVANAERRERKAALKTRQDWLREAQAVFNSMIRERDYFKPCISCQRGVSTVVHGGVWDAGHFRTVGACPELRFEPLNCHKQCKDCNSNTRRGGRYVMPIERTISIRDRYRVNLIERIGLRQVEWLESYHEPLKPTAEWLQTKIREWRLETRTMRAARERRVA